MLKIPKNSKFLEGVGESAWFSIQSVNFNEFIISRYSTAGILECENAFSLQTKGFDILQNYEFTYVSHCAKCTVLQNGKKYIFLKI